MTLIRLTALQIAALILCATPLLAQHCDATAKINGILASLYNEAPLLGFFETDSLGRQTQIQVWVSEDGTATITRAAPTGRSCVLLSGDQLMRLSPVDSARTDGGLLP